MLSESLAGGLGLPLQNSLLQGIGSVSPEVDQSWGVMTVYSLGGSDQLHESAS